MTSSDKGCSLGCPWYHPPHILCPDFFFKKNPMSLHVHPRQSTPCGRNLLCAGLEPGVWFSLLEACSQCNMGHSTHTVRASALPAVYSPRPIAVLMQDWPPCSKRRIRWKIKYLCPCDTNSVMTDMGGPQRFSVRQEDGVICNMQPAGWVILLSFLTLILHMYDSLSQSVAPVLPLP